MANMKPRGRPMQHRERLLRDGTEVTVLKVFNKPQKDAQGFPTTRLTATVRVKDTGEETEVWYTQFVEPHREEGVRFRRDHQTLTAEPITRTEPRLDSALADEDDGLAVLIGTPLHGPYHALLRVQSAEGVQGEAKLALQNGKPVMRVPLQMTMSKGRNRVQVMRWDELLGVGGPGYARIWRRVRLSEQAPQNPIARLLRTSPGKIVFESQMKAAGLTMPQLPPSAQPPMTREEWLAGSGKHDDLIKEDLAKGRPRKKPVARDGQPT